MKTLVIAVACLLVVAVHCAPTEESEDSKETTYTIVVKNDGKEREETVIIDEEKNVEIFKSVDSDEADIVEDFNTGLEAIIPKDGDNCYVRPLSNDDVPPSDLKSGLEENSKSEDDNSEKDEKDEFLTLAGRPIINRAVVGETISNKCEGRNIYWLTSLPHGDQDVEKRGCFWIRYCRYTYLGDGWWYRRCTYILYC